MSYVHTSMGTIPSFDPIGGRRFCSLRNWRGNWTRKPRIFFSSSWARAGSSFSKPGFERNPSSSRIDLTSLDGKQRNTWRKRKCLSQVVGRLKEQGDSRKCISYAEITSLFIYSSIIFELILKWEETIMMSESKDDRKVQRKHLARPSGRWLRSGQQWSSTPPCKTGHL